MDSASPKADREHEEVAERSSRMVERHLRNRDDSGREARWAEWRKENAGAIADYNRWFEAEGYKYLQHPSF